MYKKLLLIGSLLLLLVTACKPGVPSESRTTKSEVILDLTGVDTTMWPQVAQNFFATNEIPVNENVLILNENEATAGAILSTLSQWSPVRIARIIPAAGMAYVVYKMNVSAEEEQLVRDALALYHNYMWSSLDHWMENPQIESIPAAPQATAIVESIGQYDSALNLILESVEGQEFGTWSEGFDPQVQLGWQEGINFHPPNVTDQYMTTFLGTWGAPGNTGENTLISLYEHDYEGETDAPRPYAVAWFRYLNPVDNKMWVQGFNTQPVTIVNGMDADLGSEMDKLTILVKGWAADQGIDPVWGEIFEDDIGFFHEYLKSIDQGGPKAK